MTKQASEPNLDKGDFEMIRLGIYNNYDYHAKGSNGKSGQHAKRGEI